MTDALLTSTQAATVLGVHRDTLVRWTDDGKVPVVRLPSGHRRYRREDVVALLTPEPDRAA